MKTKSLNEKRGISLIVLVITIIVIIILAVAVILSIANNNPIENANKAKFQNDLKSMQEELELIKQNNYVNNKGQGYGTIQFSELTGHEKYDGKFTISAKGKLCYVASGLSDNERKWAIELGMEDSIEYTVIGGDNSKYVIESAKITAPGGTTYDVVKNQESGKYTDILITSEGKLCSVYSVDDELYSNEIYKNGIEKVYDQVENLEIPSQVKVIGKLTFCSSTNLKNVKFPEGVIEIEEGAFSDCHNLEVVEFPKTLKKIGNNAIANCEKMKSIKIPENVEEIGASAFMACTNLENVEINSKNLTTIGDSAFEMTKIQEIFIPKSVTNIGSYALYSNELKKITIENGSTLDISNATSWGISEVLSTDTSTGNTVLNVRVD